MLLPSSEGMNLVQADAGRNRRRTWNKQDKEAYDPTCCCGPENCYMNMEIRWGGTLLMSTNTYVGHSRSKVS